MKKKNAFTLIELLAVIVIIGLLLVIIVPKTNKTIKNSKEKTNEASLDGLLRAADNYYANESIKGTSFQSCTYDFENNTNTCHGLEFTGKKPKSGKLNIDEKGNVSFAIRFDDTCYKKSFDEIDISKNQYNSNECVVQQYNVWDGTSEAITPNGNIYYVSNPKQLAWISEQTNSGANDFEGKQIILTNNINMGANFDSEGNLLDENSHAFTPIGLTEGYEFRGNFDGNNYKISNLYINTTETKFTGLFGRFFGTEFKNLTLENSYISSIKNVVGIIGGNTVDAPSLTIQNVKSINNIIKTQGFGAGGIIGSFAASGSITNCYSNSTVSAVKYAAGGITALFNGLNVSNNVNDGNVTGKNYVGGIIGTTQGSKSTTTNIKNNINNGMIRGETKCIGGIVGVDGLTRVSGENAQLTFYLNNVNNGKVEMPKGGFSVGGIVGDAINGIVLVNNVNNENIDGLGDGTNSSYGIGGIIGTFGTDAENNTLYVYNNINIGNVKGGLNAGGIAGNLYNVTTAGTIIKNAINEGTVEATYAGGIIGVYDTNTATEYLSDFITNAYNKGTIKGTNAAGLVGRNIGIKNSITTGTLQGTNNYGVIANAVAGVNISDVYYPNTYTSSYGTAFDVSTLNATMVQNILGDGFKYENGTVKLYEANLTITNNEITNFTYNNKTLN